MNFLAHLHLAQLANSSLLGNLMADFVRGNPQHDFADDVVSGIRLHRRIDVLTDSQAEVKAAVAHFSPDYRRVAPITLDVLWDHFLSLHWSRIHPQQSLDAFVASARVEIESQLADTPERFQNLNHYLWRERWLQRYAELPFIADVLQRMAIRRPRLAALAGSFHDVERHYLALEDHFWRFYPAMMEQARQQQI